MIGGETDSFGRRIMREWELLVIKRISQSHKGDKTAVRSRTTIEYSSTIMVGIGGGKIDVAHF